MRVISVMGFARGQFSLLQNLYKSSARTSHWASALPRRQLTPENQNGTSLRRYSADRPRPIVYSFDASPPCRAVLLLAKAIHLDLQVQEVSLWKKDHLQQDFIKINPQHTIPTLDDGGFILSDSHAIMCYLVGKYAKDDVLYPRDLRKRAIVDQRLHFETGVLFPCVRNITIPLIRFRQEIPEEKIELVKESYGFLDQFLDGKKWLAGDSYTLADISCVTTLSSLTAFVPIDAHHNIVAWLGACERELPGYEEINLPGNMRFHASMKKLLSKITSSDNVKSHKEAN